MREDGKGAYRSVYCSIWDDPEFQGFSPHAQLVFFSLRTCKECNFPCIFTFYPSSIIERMPKVPYEDIMVGWEELVAAGWIKYQRPVLWIVKGLVNEPNFGPKNPKHILGIQNILNSLPKLEILNDFRKYYRFRMPKGRGTDTGIDTHADQGEGEGEGEGEGNNGGGNAVDIEALVPKLRPCPKITEAVKDMTDEEYDRWVRFAYNLILDHKKVDEWREAFPNVNVFHELNKASDWLLNNPHKRRSHAFQYYGNWIRNAATPRERRTG